jgi:hypothetical protein
MSSFQIGFWITQPSFALEPRTDVDRREWSRFECASHLIDKGWQLRLEPSGRGQARAKADIEPYNLERASGRFIFVDAKTGGIRFAYLRVLVAVSDDAVRTKMLLAGVQEIKHFEGAKYYELLTGEGNEAVRDAKASNCDLLILEDENLLALEDKPPSVLPARRARRGRGCGRGRRVALVNFEEPRM